MPEVCERRAGLVHDVAARGDGSAAASGEDDGEIFRAVRVAVAHSRTEDDHALVEQCAAALADAAQFSDEVGVLLDVPLGDPLVVFEFRGVVFMMRRLVVRADSAAEECKAARTDGVAKHERGDARGVGPEGERHEIQHEPRVLGVVARALAEIRGIGIGINAPSEFIHCCARGRIGHRGLVLALRVPFDPALHGADAFEIFVELRAVAGTELLVEALRIAGDEIEHASVAGRGDVCGLASGRGLRAEQTFKGELRVDFLRERQRRLAPRDVRAVELRVADVRVHAGRGRFDAELERGQRSEVADLFCGNLIHRDAVAIQRLAGCVCDGRAREVAARLHVMAVSGVARVVHQFAEHEDVVLHFRERRERLRELEIAARRAWRPQVGMDAVRDVEMRHPHGKTRAFRSGQHGFEHGQRERRADSLQHGASCDVHDHGVDAVACISAGLRS